jgi:hypothetical protein
MEITVKFNVGYDPDGELSDNYDYLVFKHGRKLHSFADAISDKIRNLEEYETKDNWSLEEVLEMLIEIIKEHDIYYALNEIEEDKF